MLDADYMRQPCGSDAHARVVDIQSLEPAWESQADIVEETAGPGCTSQESGLRNARDESADHRHDAVESLPCVFHQRLQASLD